MIEVSVDPGQLVVVVGPTGTGKTDLAIALAEQLDGEVIGADSVQIYQRFDIGSGKPSVAERARVRHHLVDIVDARHPIDAAQFAALADQAIADVLQRGKRPIICGGTFLWVKSLLFGLAEAAPRDESIRERHRLRADQEGRPALHAELAKIDPASAAKLAPNDLVRVSRALEVFELTGRPLSEVHSGHGFSEPRYSFKLVGPHRERDELDRRLRARVLGWLEQGWLDEVHGLIRDGFRDTRPMSSVGYKQMLDLIDGRLDEKQLVDEIVKVTRVLVRRQRTWLRDEPVQWLNR
ncbi:MAG: tRNA (adenosine(37)-N6)-dimethylallyltransferase MiaA [Polyangiaceae bacterium]